MKTQDDILKDAILDQAIKIGDLERAFSEIRRECKASSYATATSAEIRHLVAQWKQNDGKVFSEPVHKCLTCKNALITTRSDLESDATFTKCLLDRELKREIGECNRYHAVNMLTRRQAKEALAGIRSIPSPAFEKIATLIDRIYNGIFERH